MHTNNALLGSEKVKNTKKAIRMDIANKAGLIDPPNAEISRLSAESAGYQSEDSE